MTEAAQKLRAFISYARRDASAFADELLAGLEVAGFDPFLDRHDIAGGEDWEARLEGLIKAADTVVFIITPASIASERCAWEIARSEALSKRIIPVVLAEVPEADIPGSLKRLNYIFFTPDKSFARSLGDLAKALCVDLDWIREHTRLAEVASRWRQRDRADVLLLRGSELDVAKAWLIAWKPGAPEPSDLHRSFVSESDAAERTRNSAESKRLQEMAAAQVAREEALKQLSRRTTFGIIAAGGLATGAAGLAYWGNDAERRVRVQQEKLKAQETREKAELAKAEAREKANLAEVEKRSFETKIREQAMRTDVVGQIVAYAASPGQNAEDGPAGGNSPYTSAVLPELRNPMTSMLGGLMRGHAEVPKKTSQRQRPYLSTDTNADVYLLQQPEIRRRLALSVSVDRFQDGDLLQNVHRDADSWAEYLVRAGFKVTRLRNPTFEQMTKAIANFNLPPKPVEHGSLWTKPSAGRIQRAGIQIAPVDRDAPPNTFLFFFYSGFGFTLNFRDSLAMLDTAVDTTDAGKPVVSAAFDLGNLLANMRERAAISAAVLDTNFNRLDNLRAR